MDGRQSLQSLRATSWMLAMLAIATCCGCTVIRSEYRTLIGEPIKFGPNADLTRTKKHNRKLAKAAFNRFTAAHPEPMPLSAHYRDGFIDGYADYLTFGGSGAPPIVPPRRYWNLSHRDPQGQNAVQDWFAGFAVGTSEAKVSGLREQQTVLSTYVRIDESDAWHSPGQTVGPGNNDESWEPLPLPHLLPRDDRTLPLEPPSQPAPLPPSDADTDAGRTFSRPSDSATRDYESGQQSRSVIEGRTVPPRTQPELPAEGARHHLPEAPLPADIRPAQPGSVPEQRPPVAPSSSRRTHMQNPSVQLKTGRIPWLPDGSIRQASHSESQSKWRLPAYSGIEHSEKNNGNASLQARPGDLSQFDLQRIGKRVTSEARSLLIERLPPVDESIGSSRYEEATWSRSTGEPIGPVGPSSDLDVPGRDGEVLETTERAW